MHFDPRAAKLLKAGEHITLDGAPGLRLVASASGRTWVYRYRSPVDDRMRQIKIGSWPALSVAAAAGEWERLRAARDAGQDPAQERRAARKATLAAPKPTPGPASVGALVDGYMGQLRRTPGSMAQLRRMMARCLTDEDRARSPADVSRAVAYEVIMRNTHAPTVAKALRSELGSAWAWAHDAGLLAEEVPNWWREVLKGKIKSKGKIIAGEHRGVVKRALSVAEVGQLVGMLPRLPDFLRDTITLYLWTGCRGAEIVAMEGREVAEVDGVLWWVIPRNKVKMRRMATAADQPVPLLGRAADVVRARVQAHGTGALFPPVRGGKTKHLAQTTVAAAVWHRLAECTDKPHQPRERWPVARWSPHDLRRTVRTQLSALGCPTEVGEAILGHIDPDPYRRHDYRPERLLWLSRLCEVWEAAATR